MNEEKLRHIHSQLKIEHGSFDDEYPEQLLSATYLTGDEKILEIGGNIGRNSLVIGHIMKNKNNPNFVVLESLKHEAQILKNNRDINNLSFHIENAALSARKLIQNGWTTIPSDTLLPGYNEVNTITWSELINKYNIDFDTLVLDCEGAFYYILQDMPEMLTNIKLILVENDYWDVPKQKYVESILLQNQFVNVYTCDAHGCQGFYEVWRRE